VGWRGNEIEWKTGQYGGMMQSKEECILFYSKSAKIFMNRHKFNVDKT
jgi:hypothetical protein